MRFVTDDKKVLHSEPLKIFFFTFSSATRATEELEPRRFHLSHILFRALSAGAIGEAGARLGRKQVLFRREDLCGPPRDSEM